MSDKDKDYMKVDKATERWYNDQGVLTPSQLVDSVGDLGLFVKDSALGKFAREATRELISAVFEAEYPENKFANGGLLPMVGGNPGATEHGYNERESSGRAKLLASGADDIPFVDHSGKRNLHEIRTVAIGFKVTLQELRAAAMNGMNELNAKAAAAREAHDQTMELLIRDGDQDAGFNGMVNPPGSEVVTADTAAWGDATAGADIVSDFRKAINSQVNDTDAVEMGNTVLMPVETWTLLNTKVHLPTASDRSIMSYLREAFPQISRWDWVPTMKSADGSGGPAILIYNNSARKMYGKRNLFMAPVMPQRENLSIKYLFETRWGGVVAPKPKSVTRLVGFGS